MNNNIFKTLVGVSVVLSLMSCRQYISKKELEIKDINGGYYTQYSDGFVYIGNKNFFKEIEPFINYNDVLVEDIRYSLNDPDMKVYSSYLIKETEKQEEIIDILCCYEECFPSRWDRTKESMRLEWIIHNMSYDLDYQRDRSTDVDFDNDDEELYKNKILQKMFGI